MKTRYHQTLLHRFTMLLSLVFLSPAIFAQTGYRVTYNGQYKNTGISSSIYHLKRVIITDSAYYSFPVSSRKSDQGKFIYGEKIRHHSLYYFPSSGDHYSGNNFQSKPHLTNFVPKKENSPWQIDTSITHFYKEFRCANAFKIKPGGDTIFMVYTPDIKYPPGLNYYE